MNGMGDMGGGMPMEEEEMGDEQMMAELMEAMQAGDNAEAEGDVAPVPGAEMPEAGMGEQMDPAKLMELLEMLKSQQNDGSSNMGGAGGL